VGRVVFVLLPPVVVFVLFVPPPVVELVPPPPDVLFVVMFWKISGTVPDTTEQSGPLNPCTHTHCAFRQ